MKNICGTVTLNAMHLAPLLFFLCLFSPPVSGQFLFHGTAPEKYRGKVAHLDVIDGWDDFHLIADRQLLLESPIDSAGRYKFSGIVLPRQQGFYRVRFRDPAVCASVCMDFQRRHYITFFAGPRDTLQFDGLSIIGAKSINRPLNQLAFDLDELDEEALNAETDRLTELIDGKRRELLSGYLSVQEPVTTIFALGNWPGLDAPLAEMEELEGLLAERDDIKDGYLATLQADIGARRVAGYRSSIQLLTLLLALAVAIIFLLLFLLWRGRRYRVEGGGALAETAVSPVATDYPVTPELSPKEEEVLAAIVAGNSNKEIAAKLFVSEATVKSHINSIYKKLGVKRRKEAITLVKSR